MSEYRCKNVLIVPGRSHPDLAWRISKYMRCRMKKGKIANFFNGEIKIQVPNVRGCDVYILQTLADCGSFSVNDLIMETALIADAAIRSSARTTSLITPCFAYQKQERMTKGREPISAKVVAQLLDNYIMLGRNISMDLHHGSIAAHFSNPVDNLYGAKFLMEAFVREYKKFIEDGNLMILSPDAGGVSRAEWFASHMGLGLAMSYKSRPRPDVAEIRILGDVEGKISIVPDDLISSGGTLIKIGECQAEKGGRGIIPLVTHPSPKISAMNNLLANKNVRGIAVMDTIPVCFSKDIVVPEEKKMVVVDPSPLIGRTIIESQKKRQQKSGSVSKIYELTPEEIGLRYWIISGKNTKKIEIGF